MSPASPASAMLAYVRSMLPHDPHTFRALPWDAQAVAAIEAEREAVRVDEGGGGMCHVMSEILWQRHGWMRLPVSYLDTAGEVISAGHLINVLPDGSLLDTTADQMGEGHSVRILSPLDDDYGRYRPEFDGDFNPDIAPEDLRGFAWNGLDDADAQDAVVAQRGHGWWLADTTPFMVYLEHQVELGADCYSQELDLLRRASRPAPHQSA